MDLRMELTLFSEPVDIDYSKHKSYIERWFQIFGTNIMWPRWNEQSRQYDGDWSPYWIDVDTLTEEDLIWGIKIMQIDFLLNGSFAFVGFDGNGIRLCHTVDDQIAISLWNVLKRSGNVSPIREYWNEHHKQQAGINYVKSF